MELIIKCNDQDIEELFKNRFPDMDKIRDDFWRENENGKLKDEIQDLKLENDRLQNRNDLMEKVLHSIACDCFCDDCVLVDNNDCDKLSIKMDLARNTLRKLVDL